MSGAVYGGDEVGAVVLDVGSYRTKVGFAGEDTPKAVFPTLVGCVAEEVSGDGMDTAMDAVDGEDAAPSQPKTQTKYTLGTTSLNTPVSGRELKSPIKDGMIEDWELYEQLLDYTYAKCLQCDSKDRPILVSESAWAPKEMREKQCELLFEKYNVPGFYLGKSPVLSSFANGRGTSLVVDSGAEFTTVVPVYDGRVLMQGVRRNRLAGNYVTDQFTHVLKNKIKVDVVPAYMVAGKTAVEENAAPRWTRRKGIPEVTESYSEYMRKEVLRDLQATVCRVSDHTFSAEALANIPTTHYEFPNGYNCNWGLERYRISEGLFNPYLEGLAPAKDDPKATDSSADASADAAPVKDSYSKLAPTLFSKQTPGAVVTQDTLTQANGVQRLICDAIQACDVDVQSNLWSNIVLCGANVTHQGYSDRLHNELLLLAPPSTRFKINMSSSTTEVMFSSWLGGSIFASLGSFQQLWVSKEEYDEMGPSIVGQRCV
eukprot:m.14038 g.14038  ORF g.14038 m.14038 type:complete len:485 (-) comp6119_c0_seq1:231-1685(-)